MRILSEDLFKFLNNIRFQWILVVTPRTVDAVASSGTASAPFLTIVFVKFVPAKSAFHASIPVSKSNLFKIYPLT
jgi:hypothetical protein